MWNWLLLLAPVALIACDRPDERDALAAAATANAPAAPAAPAASPPVPIEEPSLTPKIKPVVIDLGGIQAGKAVGCALTVRFGSIGTGTDTVAKRRIDQVLEEDPAVAQLERFIVGREGETFTCVRLHRQVDADPLFDKLRAAAADGYMVTIRTESGREFIAPRKALR
jgi:hypothetical protein